MWEIIKFTSQNKWSRDFATHALVEERVEPLAKLHVNAPSREGEQLLVVGPLVDVLTLSIAFDAATKIRPLVRFVRLAHGVGGRARVLSPKGAVAFQVLQLHFKFHVSPFLFWDVNLIISHTIMNSSKM